MEAYDRKDLKEIISKKDNLSYHYFKWYFQLKKNGRIRFKDYLKLKNHKIHIGNTPYHMPITNIDSAIDHKWLECGEQVNVEEILPTKEERMVEAL